MSTNEIWHFVCNKRVKPDKGYDVATYSLELSTAYKYTLRVKSMQSMRDHHLWLSIFLCPRHSTFTRVQRLSCGFALFMSVMLVDIFFYDVAMTEIHEELIFDAIRIDITQIKIGIQSILMTIPLSLFTVFLFRNTAPYNAKFEVRFGDRHDAHLYSSSTYQRHGQNQKRLSDEISATTVKKSFILPWWCIVLPWALTMSTCLVASYVTLMYGLSFGLNKSLAWLSSFLVATSNSVAIFQPLKVAIIVMIMTLLLKMPVGPIADITPRVNLGRSNICFKMHTRTYAHTHIDIYYI